MANSMNIVYLEHYAGSDRHGMEYRPFFMAREWVKAGDRVTIVASSFSHMRRINPDMGGRDILEETIDGVRFLWLRGPQYEGNGLGRIKNILSFLGGVRRHEKEIVAEGRPDVVIASSTYPLDIYPARRIAKRYGAQLIYEMHDLWPLSPMELGGMSKYHPFIVGMQIAENACYKHCDYVVSLLPCAKEHMVEHGMDPDKFVFIPNGILRGEWDKPAGSLPSAHHEAIERRRGAGDFLIAYTGAHGIANALDSYVEAGSLLKGRGVSLFLVGQGPERDRLCGRIQELGLSDTVISLPAVKKEDMPGLLAQFDALYIGLQRQPLFRFGVSPNKLMDYMMAGKPVIFAIDAGNDMVADAGCGISIPPEDSDAIARAALALRDTPVQELEAMGRRGREYILEHHEYGVLSERFREVFRRGKFVKKA